MVSVNDSFNNQLSNFFGDNVACLSHTQSPYIPNINSHLTL